MSVNNAACLSSMCTPSRRPARADSCLAEVEQLLEGERRRTWPSYIALPGRFRGQRSRARSCAELVEVEVLHEPAVLHPSPSTTSRRRRLRELRPAGHVGGPRQVEVVPADKDAVAGAHHVGLDRVGPGAPGQPVGEGGVLRSVAAGAAVSDHEWSSHDSTVGRPGDGTVKTASNAAPTVVVMQTFGTLTLQPALERPDLLGDPGPRGPRRRGSTPPRCWSPRSTRSSPTPRR